MISVGIATMRPKMRVWLWSALSSAIAVYGPGCGGTSPWRTERPARAGIPIRINVELVRRATDDDRDEDHHAHLEEQRQPDDGGDEGHAPREHAAGESVGDPVDDVVGPTRVGQDLAEHRAEGDEDAHCSGGAAEPVGEAGQRGRRGDPRDGGQRRGAEDQREERVHLQPADQHDDDGDPGEARQDQLAVPGRADRVGQRRDGR